MNSEYLTSAQGILDIVIENGMLIHKNASGEFVSVFNALPSELSAMPTSFSTFLSNQFTLEYDVSGAEGFDSNLNMDVMIDVAAGELVAPEPATLLLLGTGFVMLCYLGRRRQEISVFA
jgi:hypothetical protein